MSEENANSSNKEKLEQWLLRGALTVAIFFGGKWFGKVDKIVDNSAISTARLERVEDKLETVDKLARTQQVMLANQLEMNSFIARQYGNEQLANKFKAQLEVLKEEKKDDAGH